MSKARCALTLALAAAAVAGALALLESPVAADPGGCPTRPLPPDLEQVCRACPTFVDPVTCTVVCAGGPQQMTFSNQCFASCSGHIILGECTRTGG